MSTKTLAEGNSNFRFKYNLERRRRQSFKKSEMSNFRPRMRRNSNFARYSPHSGRRYSENSVRASMLKVNSPLLRRRLSLPESNGVNLSSSDPDAWVTDCIAVHSRPVNRGDSTSTFIRKGDCVSKKSKGPYLASYQLLGDSLFVRFADQILKSPAVMGENGKFSNGYCVSGQTIMDLDERINRDFTCTDVMILIGTNNFLRKSYLNSMMNEMKKLVDFLLTASEKIVLLTLPPVPRLENTTWFWDTWEKYNDWLKSLDNGSTIRVIDVAPLFMIKPRTPDMVAFESSMGYGINKREDHIHLNKVGLLRLYKEIKKQLKID